MSPTIVCRVILSSGQDNRVNGSKAVRLLTEAPMGAPQLEKFDDATVKIPFFA